MPPSDSGDAGAGLVVALHRGELHRLVLGDHVGDPVADADLDRRGDRRHGQRDQQPEPVVPVAAAAQHADRVDRRRREAGDHDGGQEHVHGLRRGRRVEHRRRPGRRRPLARRSRSESARGVHPGVGGDDEERARPCPATIIGRRGEHVRARRHAVPAEQVDADEDRLDEEREALQREREAVHLAEAAPSGRATACPSRTTGSCRRPRPTANSTPIALAQVCASAMQVRVAASCAPATRRTPRSRGSRRRSRRRRCASRATRAICIRAGNRFWAASASRYWSTPSPSASLPGGQAWCRCVAGGARTSRFPPSEAPCSARFPSCH